MFEEKKYYCSEDEKSFTESELKAFYSEAVKSGCYEGTFCEWLNGCMIENNGSLEVSKLVTTIRSSGHTFQRWSISTRIGRSFIVRRHGAFWKAENGLMFSAENFGAFWNETEGGYYDMVKRISEDCIVLREEV